MTTLRYEPIFHSPVEAPPSAPEGTGTGLSCALSWRARLGRGALVAAAALSLGVGCVAAPVEPDDGAIAAAGAALPLGLVKLPLAQLLQTFDDACDPAILASYGFGGSCSVTGFARNVIDPINHVVEYSADLQVGPGPHDLIGIHRVVVESSPYKPAPSSTAAMLVHGDAWPFRGAFLDTGDGDAFAAFLARGGVDVWGIDLRWTRVPVSVADFSFMSGWGMAQDAQDLGVALSFARVNRSLTGSDILPLKLLGWSRGGQLGYAYLGGETLVPAAQRHVDGFIPVDIYLKTDLSTDEGVQQKHDACARLTAALDQYNNPMRDDRYYISTGLLVSSLGQAALSDPALASPLQLYAAYNITLTNRQVALLAGEQTYVLASPPPTPSYHLTGGTFDTSGAIPLPDGLTYIGDETRWFAAEAQAAPFQALQVVIDAEKAICGDPSSTIDANLAAISVPVLYVGAAGGFGASGLYTTSLLASPDKSDIVVSQTSSQIDDIGHSDIFLADDAETLFWDGILGWLEAFPECEDDSECTLLADNDTCQCLGAPAGTAPPMSDGACIVDPCRFMVPACYSGTCMVGGEM